MLPSSWALVELNPSHVTEQRRVLGKRGIKTDQVDLAVTFHLLVVGRGRVVARRSDLLLVLQAWAGLRHRRITAVIAMAHRANRIAFAMARDQTPYDPRQWS